VGDAIAAHLRKEGESVLLIFPETGDNRSETGFSEEKEGRCRIDPCDPLDFNRLVDESRDGNRPCKGIIHLWSLDTRDETMPDSPEATRMPVWGSILYLVQALAGGQSRTEDARPEIQPRLWLVTRGAQSVSFPEPVLSPRQSLLWGLANGVRLEHPEWNCTSIDLGPLGEEDPIPLLFESIRFADEEDRIAIRGHSRFGARIMPLPLPHAGDFSLPKDATYLVTGGLGALGIETARWLTAKGAANLVLVGRSDGSVSAKHQVTALEQSGVSIKLLRADISDPAEVSRMLAALSGMPPLKGIIHAAGVLADGILTRQDRSQFQKVIAPKVAGAWNLHEATKDLTLDFFVCFSSAASVLGAVGQSNYAAANAFLDGLAYERRRQALHGLSLNWGPWELGMAAEMGSRNTERITAQGFKGISPARGFETLERLLLQDETQAIVLPINWTPYLRHHYRGAIPPFFETITGGNVSNRGLTAGKSAIHLKLEGALPSQRRPLLLDYVQHQVGATLRMKSSKRVPADQGLFDLGLDSLMALELKNRFETDLGKALKPTLVFDHPTVTAIADYLAMEMGVTDETPSAPPTDMTRETVEVLSATEIDASIASELARLESLLKGK
jgi:short-subunit dehydrogenase/acyl carrier protein